jgi:hypothetical protein
MHERPIDDTTADRLLGGAIRPDDAPPGTAGVAALIAAARSAAQVPAPTDDAFVASLAAAVPATGPHATRRRPMISRLLTAKAAAIGGVALFGASAAAASAGTLPAPAQDAVSKAFDKAGVSVPASKGASHGNSEFGHCTAFLAQQREGRDDEGDDDATEQTSTTSTTAGGGTTSSTEAKRGRPFTALLEAHGGVAGTTSYCEGVVAAKKAGKAGKPEKSTTSTTTSGDTTSTTAKSAADHGKAGDDHGKSGEKHGKSGDDHGTTDDSTTATTRVDDDDESTDSTTATTHKTSTTRPTTSTTEGPGDGHSKGHGGPADG